MRIKELKKVEDHRLLLNLIRSHKIKMEGDFIVLWLSTGFAWNRPLIVEGTDQSDILGTLEEMLHNGYLVDVIPLYDQEDINIEDDPCWEESYLYLDNGLYMDAISEIIDVRDEIEVEDPYLDEFYLCLDNDFYMDIV